MELDPSSSTMATAMLAYNRWVPLRAAMQLLPGLGGAIDTLVSGYAGKIQEQRVQSFLTVLDSRLRELPDSVTFPNHSAPPHFACPVRAECGDVRGA